MPVAEGKQAPDFTLADSTGKKHSLKSLRGKVVILYFYPKDDTPGCTKEACGFRDLHEEFVRKDAVVVGVSPDGASDHSAFASKYNLPFILLSDPDKAVMTAYGAWGEKVMYGKKTVGVIRSTVLIGKDGNVLRHWKKVANAEEHPAQVLKALEELLPS